MPEGLEVISLSQCAQVLSSHDIVILAPKELDLGAYRERLKLIGELRVRAEWMASRAAYNRLMIAPWIYRELSSSYSHMLIHEPDAIVLRDELQYWCSQPLDYIGAPWFEGFDAPPAGAALLGVGNFGFSLMRLEAAVSVLSSQNRWYASICGFKDIAKGLKGSWKRLRRGVLGLGSAAQLRGAYRIYEDHCDRFWSNIVPAYEPTFRVASMADAIRFAWEVLPDGCFDLCGGRLPFGIHAWARYNLEFLKPHLAANGVRF